MVLKEIGWEVVDWIHVAQDRDRWWAFVNAAVNPRIAKSVGNLTNFGTIGF